jgi:hypothetical protein
MAVPTTVVLLVDPMAALTAAALMVVVLMAALTVAQVRITVPLLRSHRPLPRLVHKFFFSFVLMLL